MQSCGDFFLLIVDVRESSLFGMGPPLGWWPGVYKKVDLEIHGEQISKQHPFMASASILSSKFLAYPYFL